MHAIGGPELFAFATVAALLLWGNKIPTAASRLIEALDNLRGGPGSPMHPLPSDDSQILNRKRQRQNS